MTSRDFCYWLQGFLELTSTNTSDVPLLTGKQMLCIINHLNMVFKHEIDPSMGDAIHQNHLNTIHNSNNNDNPVYRC